MALNVNGNDQSLGSTVSIEDTDTVRLAVDYSGYESCAITTSPSGVLTVTKVTEGTKQDIYSIEVASTGTATLTLTYTDSNNETTTETITFDAVKGAEPTGIWTGVTVSPVLQSAPWVNLDPTGTYAQQMSDAENTIDGIYGMPYKVPKHNDYMVAITPQAANGETPEAIASVVVTSNDTTKVSVISGWSTANNVIAGNASHLKCEEYSNDLVPVRFDITTVSGRTYTKWLLISTLNLHYYFTVSGGSVIYTGMITAAHTSTVRIMQKTSLILGGYTLSYSTPPMAFIEPTNGWNSEQPATTVTEGTTGGGVRYIDIAAADIESENTDTRTVQVTSNPSYSGDTHLIIHFNS